MNHYSLKERIKRIDFVKRVLDIKQRIKCKNFVLNSTRLYEKRYLDHSTSIIDYNDPLCLRRIIIIDSHILEKGLSHNDFRSGFGRKIVEELQQCLRAYAHTPDSDRFAVNNAAALLLLYHKFNKENGFDDSSYLNTRELDTQFSDNLTPYKLALLQTEQERYFREYANRRHSVRCYEEDGLPIEKSLLMDVVSLANTAPSACNRQATHLFAISERELLEKIEKIHGGCKGFGRHVSAFIFVTSDLSLYSANEAKIPAYDAGIYTMNLLYALQSYGLYSCALNGSFPGKAGQEIREVTNISDRYEIQGLVAVYKLADTQNVKIAVSPRRDSKEIISFIE